MADMQRLAMSDSEREVLKVLWDHGAGTVREVLELLTSRGQQWTRSTVITLLQRLEKKGYVDSDTSRFAFVFRAAVSRDEVVHGRLLELADEFSDGDATPLVLAFAKQHQFTPEEVARFRRMIDAMVANNRPKPAK